MSIQEKQLGQLRPADTNAASIYSPATGVTWVAKSIVVCNTTGSAATFYLYHDEDGTTYSEATALFWNVSVAAAESKTYTFLVTGSNSSGNLAVKSGTADALTFTLYGAEIT